MIQVFEPFRSKIKLHIGETFLQELWDRYVPVSSDAYEKISLIYLNGRDSREGKSALPAQQAVNLAVKNIITWMDLRQNPILISSQVINQSIRNSTCYCLEQLKRGDHNTYRFLEKQVSRLEQEEQDDRRYQEWERETKAIEIWRREYRLLEQISLQIQKKSGEPSVKQEQESGEEIIRQVLDELQPAERKFAESSTEICRILKSFGDISQNVSRRLYELREIIRNREESSLEKYRDVLREADISFPGGSQSEEEMEWRMPDDGEKGDAGTEEAGNATQSIYERELREWGAELLVYAGYGDGQEEDTVFRDRKYEVAKWEENASVEPVSGEERDSSDRDEKTGALLRDTHGDQALQPVEIPGQTSWADRSKQPDQANQERQAAHEDEAAQISRTNQEKVRSLLRSMEEQVSRRIRVRTEHEDFRLTYGDSILQNRTIQRMMEYVGTLDAEEYPRFVRELSESVFLQWQERQENRITVKNENRSYSEKELQLVHIDTLTDNLYAGRAEADRGKRVPEQTDTSTAGPYVRQTEPDRRERMPEQTDISTASPYAEHAEPDRRERVPEQTDISTAGSYAGHAEPDRRERIPDRTDTSTASSQSGRRYPDNGENVSENIPGAGAGIWSGENKDGFRRTEESGAAGSRDVAEDIRQNEFREWGRALLVYAGYGDRQEEDTVFRDRKYEVAKWEENASAEPVSEEDEKERDSADREEKTAAVLREMRGNQALQPVEVPRQTPWADKSKQPDQTNQN